MYKDLATISDQRVLSRFRQLFGKNLKQNQIYAILLDNGCKPIGKNKYGRQLFVYGSDDDFEITIDYVLNKLANQQFANQNKQKEKPLKYKPEDYTPKDSIMKNASNDLLKKDEVWFDDEYDDELYESLCKNHKTVYITESQLKYIKENNWKQEFYDTYIKNDFIKLYHNTTIDNLDDILNDGEIRCDVHHSEGHGNMIWFTVKDDDYSRQAKISITVDKETFKKLFNLMNSVHAVIYNNLPISQFNFKIENIEGLTYDRVMEILSKDDIKLIKYLSETLPASIWNWFLEKYDSVNSLNESMNFIEPEKVKIVKKYLDNAFVRAKMPIVGEDGYPKTIFIVGMKGTDGNVCKNMTSQQLFDLLQDKFQKIYSDKDKRDKFLKQVMKDWYNKKISREGLLSKNKY